MLPLEALDYRLDALVTARRACSSDSGGGTVADVVSAPKGRSSVLLTAKTAAVERHLSRVAAKLPPDPTELKPSSDPLDMAAVHGAAKNGAADLLAFLAAMVKVAD